MGPPTWIMEIPNKKTHWQLDHHSMTCFNHADRWRPVILLHQQLGLAKTPWVFPNIMVPPKHPKMIIFSRKTLVVGYHHFRKPPYLPDKFNSFRIFCTHPISTLTGCFVSSPGPPPLTSPSEETLWQWKVFNKPSKLNLDFPCRIMSSTNKKWVRVPIPTVRLGLL